MRILSYNVNGIRSALKKGFDQWLLQSGADVVCLQELKAQQNDIDWQIFEDRGYHCHIHPAVKKGYSGVAIFSKEKPLHVEVGCKFSRYDDEGRILRADFPEFTQLSVYFPSGSSGDLRQAFKMEFLEFFQEWIKPLQQEKKNLVISGDINICHQPIDIHDPVRNAKSSGFLPEEREWMSGFLSTGFTDSFRKIYPETKKYSWWSFRAGARKNNKGWRIDYNLTSNGLRDKIKSADILNDVIHSDHCPVMMELDI